MRGTDEWWEHAHSQAIKAKATAEGDTYTHLHVGHVGLGLAGGDGAGVGPGHNAVRVRASAAHGLGARAGVGHVARELDGHGAARDAQVGLVGERVGHLEGLAGGRRLWVVVCVPREQEEE